MRQDATGDDKLHLIRMLESIQRIGSYTWSGAQDAVIWNLEVIGEAAKRLSAGQARIPREMLVRFREYLIERYAELDPNEVWQFLERELQPLKLSVEESLAAA